MYNNITAKRNVFLWFKHGFEEKKKKKMLKHFADQCKIIRIDKSSFGTLVIAF